MEEMRHEDRDNCHFVSEFYWPSENATGHIMTRIVDTCSKEMNVHVVATGDVVPERNENIVTTRVPALDRLDKNNLRERLIKMVSVSLMLSRAAFKKVKSGDTVVVVTSPPFSIVFFALLRLFRKFRFIVIVQDLFPENLIVSGLVSKSFLPYKMLKSIFDRTYRKADTIVVCGRDIGEAIENKKVGRDKIYYIPNFADTETIRPMAKEKNPIIEKLGIADKFVVLFTGNIGRMQNIENVKGAIEILRTDEQIHWLFIGGGACAADLKGFVTDNGISNVTILDSMPRSESSFFLTAGDVGLISLAPDVEGTGVPSKTYTYLAAGLPIVGFLDEDSEIGRTIREHEVGWLADPKDPKALAKCVWKLKNERETIKLKGKLARRVCEAHFAGHVITERYVSLMDDK